MSRTVTVEPPSTPLPATADRPVRVVASGFEIGEMVSVSVPVRINANFVPEYQRQTARVESDAPLRFSFPIEGTSINWSPFGAASFSIIVASIDNNGRFHSIPGVYLTSEG